MLFSRKKTYSIKIAADLLDPIRRRAQRFLVTKDLGFSVGDRIRLEEFDGVSFGDMMTKKIAYVHRNYGILDGYTVIGFE